MFLASLSYFAYVFLKNQLLCIFLRTLTKYAVHSKCFYLKKCLLYTEAALQRCSCKKVFWKYAAKLQEHPCWSVISMKLKSNFIEITLRHGCSPVNLLHIFRTSFPKNTPGGLLLYKAFCKSRESSSVAGSFRNFRPGL